MYNTDSARKKKLKNWKKKNFKLYQGLRHARGPQIIFDVKFLKKFNQNLKMALPGPFKLWKEQSHKFWWV